MLAELLVEGLLEDPHPGRHEESEGQRCNACGTSGHVSVLCTTWGGLCRVAKMPGLSPLWLSENISPHFTAQWLHFLSQFPPSKKRGCDNDGKPVGHGMHPEKTGQWRSCAQGNPCYAQLAPLQKDSIGFVFLQGAPFIRGWIRAVEELQTHQPPEES